MLCNVNGITKVLSYKIWNGGSYGPDCAIDLLNDGGNRHDDYGNTIYTEEEYTAAVEYLKECAKEDNEVKGNCTYEACVIYEEGNKYGFDLS